MATDVRFRGYFSVLRWRSDVTRDEARNLAVLLFTDNGKYGGMKTAPLSAISPRLRDQGLMDGILRNLESQFKAEMKPDVDSITKLRDTLRHSIYLTEPQSVAVKDVEITLDTLYRAYVAPPTNFPREVTKGNLIDQVSRSLLGKGIEARRGQYINNFLFDLSLRIGSTTIVIEVLSFGSSRRRDYIPIEYDAGHFLYALQSVDAKGKAIVQPPAERGPTEAVQSHDRVRNWLDKASVSVSEPREIIQAKDVHAILLAR